jgi:hypothetical protein
LYSIISAFRRIRCNFADARAQNDLTEFFDLNQTPRPFQAVPALLDGDFFVRDKTPPTDPDDY